MDYRKIEKCLLNPTIKIVTDLAIYKQSQKKEIVYELYTFYRALDQRIVLGFTENLNEVLQLYSYLGYKILGNKIGSKNEFKILNETLYELGYLNDEELGSYSYSKSLMKYLNILGWPTSKIDKKRRISKYF